MFRDGAPAPVRIPIVFFEIRGERGDVRVKLPNGTMRMAELHWYEASGIGKTEYQIKRFVD